MHETNFSHVLSHPRDLDLRWQFLRIGEEWQVWENWSHALVLTSITNRIE